MPLINGCKYSCEPCIRGHRATSCAHTDRVLVEVRKPGRPLQTCGHKLDTYSCGRLADAFSIEGGTLDKTFTADAGSTIYVTAKSMSPTSSTKPKTKTRVAGKWRVTKRRASKAVSPTTSPLGDAQSSEAATGVGKEREQDSDVPIEAWQDIHPQDLHSSSELEKEKGQNRRDPREIWQNIHQEPLSVLPRKSPTVSLDSPTYVFKNAVSPPIQALPPITPLLGVHEERENGQAKAAKHRSSPQASMQPPLLNYGYRVEDISISSNGDRIVQAAYHSSFRGVRLGDSDTSWGHGREKWQMPFDSR